MPISDCEVRDPRIRRTRQLLQSALQTLMQTRSFDEIAVQDITEAATVNRATFYDHYADKYALLEAMVAGGFHTLLAERKVRYDGSCPSEASALILAACDYLAQTHSGSSTACQRQSAFEPLVEAAIISAIRRLLLTGLPREEFASGVSPEMIATTASWTINGAVRAWFNTPRRPAAEEIVPLILRWVIPILESANERAPAFASQV
jgi:AcrR family transcriptional regulator